jgi:SAM-dependent methyltransferase
MMGDHSRILEIGPFANPLVSGEHVSYADFLDTGALIARAKALGIDYSKVPAIQYVLSQHPIAQITEKFDCVLSCHCIEHQPNLIKHLSDVYGLLKSVGGKYVLLVPDKRYCFDRYIAESTIADIMNAYYDDKLVHTLKSVIEHRALMVHNDPGIHWNDPLVQKPQVKAAHVEHAVNEWRHSGGAYIDVHAWYFTPSSFKDIIGLLNEMGLTGFNLDVVYSTRHGANEFWAVLGV